MRNEAADDAGLWPDRSETYARLRPTAPRTSGTGRRVSVSDVRRRRSERGVSVFVVMMAIMVLSGAGVWAIYLSSLTDAGSGYQRAAAQALYMAEAGTLAGSAYLSIPGVLDANYQVNSKTPDPCKSVSTGQTCIALTMDEINQRVATETAGDPGGPFNLLDLTGGSLAADNRIDGTFVVELSELRTVDVEGMSSGVGQSNLHYKTATVTSYGTVRPAAAGDLCAGVNENASSTRLASRARMIVGPLTD